MTSNTAYATLIAKVQGREYGQYALSPLQGVNIKATLRGPLLDVVAEQSFLNPFDSDVELVYTFPLPERAQLTGLTFELRGTRYSGVVRAKAVASREYETALSEGDTPVLVERTAQGLFTANLGNLPAGETAKITVRFAQRVLANQNAWRVCIPTVIAPRYGDPIADGRIPPHATPTNTIFADYPLSFELLVADKSDPRLVSCPSHTANIATTEAGLLVTLPAAPKLDRDIVLLVKDAQPLVAVQGPDLPTDHAQTHVAMAALRLPLGDRDHHAAFTRPLSVRILLDCSGSMLGDSMNWATVACQRLLSQLQRTDEFSLTRFGSTQEQCHHRMLRGDATHTRVAIDWLYGVQADLGGTNMAGALDAASQLRGTAINSDILLITDGQIHASDQLIAKARMAGHRVFIIGISSYPHDHFLHDLAEATEGRCFMASPGEDLPAAIDPILTRMRASTVDTLSVNWPATPTWTLQWPQRPLPGESVYFYAGFEHALSGQLAVSWKQGEHAHQVAAAIQTVASHDNALRSVAAGERLHSGLFANPAKAAEDYQLVTEWTSLVAIAQREEDRRDGAMPRLIQIAQMMPAGYGGLGVRAPVYDGSAVWSAPRKPVAAVPDKSSEALSSSQATEAVPAFLRGHNVATHSQDDMAYVAAKASFDAEEAKRKNRMALKDALLKAAPSLNLAVQRAERRIFAQIANNEPPLDLKSLLNWAGFPERLIDELLASHAQTLNEAELTNQWLLWLSHFLDQGMWILKSVDGVEGYDEPFVPVVERYLQQPLPDNTRKSGKVGNLMAGIIDAFK